MSTLGALAACDGATTTEPAACFPVPATQALRLAPGTQLTSLQVRVDGMQAQATSPQHGTNGMQMQGTSLQGESNIMQNQGTTLQGGSARAAGRQLREYRGLRDLNGARLTIEADPSNAVRVQDGELVASGFASTDALRGTALSATTPDGRQIRVEVIAVTRDTGTERVEIFVNGVTACQPGKHGVFVAGSWDAQAAFVDDPGLVTYACMDGVIAKCVDWGYAPWQTDASIHAGCTRMARADYCGNGTPWTLDGTTISVFDTLGVHEPSTAADMTFEAAWGPSGALCVAKSRYAIQDAAANTVVPSCFASLPRCNSLDDTAARGATLGNRSRVMPIDACE